LLGIRSGVERAAQLASGAGGPRSGKEPRSLDNAGRIELTYCKAAGSGGIGGAAPTGFAAYAA